MAGQVRASVRGAEHAHVNNFSAAGKRHGGHRPDQRIAVTGDVRCPAVQNGTDRVAPAPPHPVRQPSPHAAGPDQQLRRLQRVHQKRRRRSHGVPIPAHVRIGHHRTGSEFRRAARRRIGTQVDRNSRLAVHIPVRAVAGIDSHRPALTAQNLRPIRRRRSGVLQPRGPVHPQPGHHRVGRDAGQRHALHLGQRSQASVQVLEMRGIARRAHLARLPDQVHRAPQPAVVAHKHLQRVGRVPGQRVLEFAHLRAHARRGIGGVAPHAAHGQAALPQVVRPRQQQRILPLSQCRRHRRQRQVVVAVLNGRPAVGSVRLQRLRVPLLGKGDVRACARAPADRALVLPQSLVLVV